MHVVVLPSSGLARVRYSQELPLTHSSPVFAQIHLAMSSFENNVGVLAMEVYFPSSFVKQTDMEAANGVSAGKYTIGLGQDAMAFTGDLEDVNSISLTVVQALLEKYNISPAEIGRMEIGTESLVDKSKSTKTVLMSLFAESGNTDIEGATVINACYGGTAALLNALSWVDSSAWDGRYAIVVAADIAVYADGPARPTGGCGSVAMLVGRDAPLRFDLRTRTTHATHVWDFFKPNMDSEYPEVNGALSQTCYLQALDDCYTRFVGKNKSFRGKEVSVGAADHFLFHAPYNKLVQKSFARLCYQDMLSGAMDGAAIDQWKSVPAADTYEDRGLEAALKGAAGPAYKTKVAPACEVSKKIGNTYTASVWINLANLVAHYGAGLDGQGVVLFSYGSGALASMLGIAPSAAASSSSQNPLFSLAGMQEKLDIPARLEARTLATPADLTAALQARESSHGVIPFTPTYSPDALAPGTFYLESITDKFERVYARKA
jgi:hydroxymethylglutaryl-CoA synthase